MTQSHFMRFCEPVPARRAVRRRRDAACAAALASEGQRANRQRSEAGLTGGTRGSAVAPRSWAVLSLGRAEAARSAMRTMRHRRRPWGMGRRALLTRRHRHPAAAAAWPRSRAGGPARRKARSRVGAGGVIRSRPGQAAACLAPGLPLLLQPASGDAHRLTAERVRQRGAANLGGISCHPQATSGARQAHARLVACSPRCGARSRFG